MLLVAPHKLLMKLLYAAVEQAGAQLTTNAQLACEWQRDWNRTDTVPDFVKLLLGAGDFINLGD